MPAKIDRNHAISSTRLAIEEYLADLPRGKTATLSEVAQAVGAPNCKVSKLLSSMRVHGQAENVNQGGGPGQWRRIGMRSPKAAASGSLERYNNGNQPNGTPEYWATNFAARMGTPRLSQGAA